MSRILLVVGARPNFVKAEPLLRALEETGRCEVLLVHTGQHYDASLSAEFFRDLGLRQPDRHLGVGSGSRPEQLSRLLGSLEASFKELRPDQVVVVGDVNSTFAAALVAQDLSIPLAHVEAGLRSGDRSMPEEINRLLTDSLSDMLFTSSEEAARNLMREGIPGTKIHFVGNVMIDSLRRCLPKARGMNVYKRWALNEKAYAILTVHRPSNVDLTAQLVRLTAIIRGLASRIPVIFSVHPRTMASLERLGFLDAVKSVKQALLLYPPLSYLEFISLMSSSRLVLTDSGGIQEETTVLGIPCLTLRPNTERPVTVTSGTNRVVGSEPDNVLDAVDNLLASPSPLRPNTPPLWDGRTAERIVRILLDQPLAQTAEDLALLAVEAAG